MAVMTPEYAYINYFIIKVNSQIQGTDGLQYEKCRTRGFIVHPEQGFCKQGSNQWRW